MDPISFPLQQSSIKITSLYFHWNMLDWHAKKQLDYAWPQPNVEQYLVFYLSPYSLFPGLVLPLCWPYAFFKLPYCFTTINEATGALSGGAHHSFHTFYMYVDALNWYPVSGCCTSHNRCRHQGIVLKILFLGHSILSYRV